MIADTIAVPVASRGPIPRTADAGLQADILVLTFLLVLLNLPLFAGRSTAALAFQTNTVAAGEWWRLLTHPFVHVSWYHLLLDRAAFLSLYANLAAGRRWRRLVYVVASAAGSLVVVVCVSPLIATHGLCGLSGVAHGLMAASSLEMLALDGADRGARTVGWVGFAAVIAKCVFELGTGHALFAGVHFGLLGTPIVECHAGGAIGGMLAALFFTPRRRSSGHSWQK